MTQEFDLDKLIDEEPDPGEPLGAKVDRLTRGIRGLIVAFLREKETSRRVRLLSVGFAGVAVIAVAAAVVAIVVAALSYRESNRLDDLFDQTLADRNQRRIDGCVLNNEARAANRGLVELDRQSSLIFMQVLVDPALVAAQGRSARTPEEEATIQQLRGVFEELYSQATEPLRRLVLEGLAPLDCSPEALGVAGQPLATSTSTSTSTED